jgi:hypothetical protein
VKWQERKKKSYKMQLKSRTGIRIRKEYHLVLYLWGRREEWLPGIICMKWEKAK